jgi:hypothetical protein
MTQMNSVHSLTYLIKSILKFSPYLFLVSQVASLLQLFWPVDELAYVIPEVFQT